MLLRSLRGPRPLPDTHLTPVKPPFFSFKVKSLSLRAWVKAWPCLWAPGDSRVEPRQHGGLLQLRPRERPGQLWLHLPTAIGWRGPFTTPKDSAPFMGSPRQGHPQPTLPPHHGGGWQQCLGMSSVQGRGCPPPQAQHVPGHHHEGDLSWGAGSLPSDCVFTR